MFDVTLLWIFSACRKSQCVVKVLSDISLKSRIFASILQVFQKFCDVLLMFDH